MDNTARFTFPGLFLFVKKSRFFTRHFLGAKRQLYFSQNKLVKKRNQYTGPGFLQNWELTKNSKGLKLRKNRTKHEVKLWHPYERHSCLHLQFRTNTPSCYRETSQELASSQTNSKIFFNHANLKLLFWDIRFQGGPSQPFIQKKLSNVGIFYEVCLKYPSTFR